MRIDYDHIHYSIRQKVIDMQNARHFVDRPLRIVAYDNAVIVPRDGQYAGGLYDARGPACHSNCYNVYEPSPCREQVEYADKDVLFLGMLYAPWGHCITDHLSRLWPLIEENSKDRDLDIVYVMTSPSSEMPDNYFALLELLGIDRSRIHKLEKPTQFKKVYFPDRSFWHNENCDGDSVRHYTKEYVATVNKIRAFFSSSGICKSRRVYLTRTGWKKGLVDFGERTLENAFSKYYGCEIVHPETLSFVETIKLLQQCEVLVTTDGSIAHNAIFGPDGMKMVIIRKSDFVNYHQPVINEIRNLDVTYVDAYPAGWFFNNRKEPWVGPFFMYVGEYVAQFLGCKKVLSPTELLRFVKCRLSIWAHQLFDRLSKGA